MKRSTIFVALLMASWILTKCQPKKSSLFSLVPSSQTNIHFNNLLVETEDVNVNTYMNIYTGAGVAAGDINNDGLTDLFFSGNQVTSRLYLNKGNLTFEDITESAGVLNTRWGTGAVMVDVNQDGWLDVFMCVSGNSMDNNNLIFINNKDNTFKESSKQYGLTDKRQAMHASFFDYDRDGDLDLFIITNPASYENKVNHLQPRKLHGESESTDLLYRNNGNNTFTDVSLEAGILVEGYSLGLAITDINNDQWPDIFISNDFVGNDILYVNNRDGTFINEAARYFKHTSFAGMGNDVADINNDGLVDIVELDMRPEDNKRQKLIIPPTGYDKFQLSLKMGYEPQYTRNTLQLNQGNNKFSEIAFLAGVSSTDWSWSPLLADYDNDGDKDLFVTNGFLRDLGNMDFISYQNIYNTPLGTAQSKSDKKLNSIKELEGASLRNYFYENNGHLQFIDRSEAWGIHQAGFSHGATYADLDNDGDLDIVINNMNAEASIYRNNSNQLFARNFIRIKLIGSDKNRNGIGASMTIYTHTKKQFLENYKSRGFESGMDDVLHIGLDTATIIDSLEVTWPDGNQQTLKHIESNQLLQVHYKEATKQVSYLKAMPKLFSSLSNAGITYEHKENTFVDFKVQPLLPHTHSKNGPGIAVSDLNKDGLEDFFVGGTTAGPGALFIQKPDGTFENWSTLSQSNLADDMGVLFFDADGDGDDDLYVVSGGSEEIKESRSYQDHLYLNNGQGIFTESVDALPPLIQSGSCVIAADYDHDGDLDLFVGGRLVPGEYPLPANSYLLRNDSDHTGCKFINITLSVAPKLLSLGMVTGGLWTDVDNDGWMDLMLVGEFMPITFFKNINGKTFEKQESQSLARTSGWWNSITAGDFDRDGDMDYIAGNLGLNSRYQGTAEEPVCVYAKDYDKNGSIDPVMTYYLEGNKHIIHSRDELISQISVMKLRFNNYKDYAEANFENSFLKSEIDGAYVTCAERFETSYIKNMGGGNFEIEALPIECQFAPVFGMVVNDFNEDGFLDALLTGNSYAPEGTTGRYDASVGVYLQGNGAGKFNPLSAIESGIYIDGDAKGLAALSDATGNGILLNGNNSSAIKTFVYKQHRKKVMVNNDDVYALLTLQDGSIFKQEFYFGSTYLSQSSRQLLIPSNVVSLKIFNNKGISHSVSLN
ncbi:MAG: VCBS repeat-containing protein [Cyclobacteriaceae bacterium]|nr:VCBS repeat-containing protein [Cyclobacteriaceae bacterium]